MSRFSVSLTLLVGTDKQHLDEFIAQSHKGGNFFFFVADDVKLYGKKSTALLSVVL